MLVLSRKETETIVVDGPCVIHVLRPRGNRTRLGIQADEGVQILRGEIINTPRPSGTDNTTPKPKTCPQCGEDVTEGKRKGGTCHWCCPPKPS